MRFGLELVTGPSNEPVTVAQAKAQARVDFSDDDDLIALLISAAREYVEGRMRRSIFAQVLVASYDQFPSQSMSGTIAPYIRDAAYGNGAYINSVAFTLPVPRVISVESISYSNGTETITLDPSVYTVDTSSEPARIVPANGGCWPSLNTYVPGSVVVAYTTGTYGDGSDLTRCPASVKQAVLVKIAHLYADREGTDAMMASAVEQTVDSLVSRYKYHGGV